MLKAEETSFFGRDVFAIALRNIVQMRCKKKAVRWLSGVPFIGERGGQSIPPCQIWPSCFLSTLQCVRKPDCPEGKGGMRVGGHLSLQDMWLLTPEEKLQREKGAAAVVIQSNQVTHQSLYHDIFFPVSHPLSLPARSSGSNSIPPAQSSMWTPTHPHRFPTGLC